MLKLHLDASPAHLGRCSPVLVFPVGSPRAWDRASAPSLHPRGCPGPAIMLFDPGPRKAPSTALFSSAVSLGVFRGSIYPKVGQPPSSPTSSSSLLVKTGSTGVLGGEVRGHPEFDMKRE